MSKTKGGGSTRNGRDSAAQRLGVKVFDGGRVHRRHDHRAPARHQVPPWRERRPRRRRHPVRAGRRRGEVRHAARAASSSTSICPPPTRSENPAIRAGFATHGMVRAAVSSTCVRVRRRSRSSTCAAATAGRARCRSAGRPTCPGAAPTEATAARAATCGCGRPQRGLAARLPGPSPPPGRRRHPRRGQRRATAASGADMQRGGARGHRRQGPRRRRCWPTWCATGDRWLAARGGRGGPGQRPLPVQPPPGAVLRRAGRGGRGALAPPRAQAHGRRRPGRLPQRGQEHADLPHLGGQAQDRRLPVHHPRAPPRRRAVRRARVRRGRHPRAHRGGERGPGARPPVPSPHRAGPRPARAARPGARRTSDRPRTRSDVLLAGTGPLPARAAGAAPARQWAPRPTSRVEPCDGLRISAVTGEGVDDLLGATGRAGRRGARPQPPGRRPSSSTARAEEGVRVERGDDGGFVVRRPRRRAGGGRDRPHQRPGAGLRAPPAAPPGRRPGAGPGRRPRGRPRPHRRRCHVRVPSR